MDRTSLCEAECWTQHGMSCSSQNPQILCFHVLYADERRHCHFHFPPLLQIQVPHHLRAVAEGFRRVKPPAGVTLCDITKLPNYSIQHHSHLAWIANWLWWTQNPLWIWEWLLWVCRKIFKKCALCLLCAFSSSFLCSGSDLASEHLQIQLRVSFISPCWSPRWLHINLALPEQKLRDLSSSSSFLTCSVFQSHLSSA